MAIFPIENMVLLTYNINEVMSVAEICLDCWNKLNETNHSEKRYIMSENLNLCEVCEEMKHTIIVERKSYYLRKYKYILFPLVLICKFFYLLWRILMLPYTIYKYKSSGEKDS